MSVNKAIIVGRVGNDPDINHTGSGVAVANFSVATSERYTDKAGERQEKTEWHRIVAWNRLAEICGEYLKKGREVYIEGQIQTREWQDKDGNRRFTTEIRAHTVQFLGSGTGDRGQGSNGAQRGQSDRNSGGGYQPPAQNSGMYSPTGGNISDDDIPF